MPDKLKYILQGRSYRSCDLRRTQRVIAREGVKVLRLIMKTEDNRCEIFHTLISTLANNNCIALVKKKKTDI